MSRGIEGRPLFRGDDDRRMFLSFLEHNIVKSGYRLYAWALMENHYHLVVRLNEFPLGVFMKDVNGRYARYFRRSMSMRGYLFQDRYKSIVTQDQRYVEELIRYVHLNPLRAGVCANLAALDRYPWCGHAAVMGHLNNSFQNITDILRRFGQSRDRAAAAYRAFVAEGIGASDELIDTVRGANDQTESIRHAGCWVIGNKDFVDHALKQDRDRRIRLARYAREQVGVADIARKVADQFKVPFESMQRRGKGDARSAARKAVAYICNRRYGIPVVEIARYFGISSPSVSEMLRGGETVAAGIT